MTAALLLLFQATVGDTVQVERMIQAPADAVVRPQNWDLGELGAQLAPPVVEATARGLVVRYRLVLWYPGDHALRMPGPVLVRRDGSADTLAVSTHRVAVTSVLPGDRPRAELNPRPAEAPLPLTSRSLLPAIVLAGAALLLTGLFLLGWRRPGPLPRPVPRVEVIPDPAVLTRWAAAGEYRAALDGWSWRLARRIGRSADLEEIGALQRVLDAIGDTVFLPSAGERLAELCIRAAELDRG